jgi:osmotically-inducible protein OsmY
MPAPTKVQNDAELEEAVLRRLEDDPEILSKDIGVVIKDAVVTLVGFVQSYPEKLAAERAVNRVRGVKAIVDEIEVRAPVARTDQEIAREVIRAMTAEKSVPRDRIVVCVRNGCVTLEGLVNGHVQRACAERCACHAEGVRSVVNRIRLEPSVSAAEVKAEIENALKKDESGTAPNISVWENEGTVYLYGSVGSAHAREEAEHVARSMPGVSEVKDRINVKKKGKQSHVTDSH